jgi:biopolymer transport protein ExbB
MSPELEQVWQVWRSGGWVMVPLFAVATWLYAQAFQLVLVVRRTDLDARSEVHWLDWVRAPERARGRVAEIIRYTQSGAGSDEHVRHRFEEIRLALFGRIDRRTRFVSTLVGAAPLLGLLGTVLGMLQLFFGLATRASAETAAVVASGISEALVTTMTGLTVALPGLFLVMIIQRRRHALEAKIARLENLTLGYLRFE